MLVEPGKTMREGHSKCPFDLVGATIHVWGGAEVKLESRLECHHRHKKAVQADDGLGGGPLVADFCECCGQITIRDEWVNDGIG